MDVLTKYKEEINTKELAKKEAETRRSVERERKKRLKQKEAQKQGA